MLRKIRIWFIEIITRRYIKAVTKRDVLQRVGHDVFRNNKRLTKEQVLILKEEAEALKESLLWKLMKADLESVAFDRMSKDATVVDDILFGKAMFYNFYIQELYMHYIRKL